MLRVMRRLWLPLLVLLMVVIGGRDLPHARDVRIGYEITARAGINNDAKPFNPKQVKLRGIWAGRIGGNDQLP